MIQWKVPREGGVPYHDITCHQILAELGAAIYQISKANNKKCRRDGPEHQMGPEGPGGATVGHYSLLFPLEQFRFSVMKRGPKGKADVQTLTAVQLNEEVGV